MEEFTRDTRREISREESPERFLRLFAQISGMCRHRSVQTEPSSAIAREALLAQVVGAVVIGSSAGKARKPKDLDVLLMTSGLPTNRADRFAQELKDRFDLEFARETRMVEISLGRLDIVGFASLQESDGGIFQQAIREAETPIMFAYGPGSTREIEAWVQRIRSGLG